MKLPFVFVVGLMTANHALATNSTTVATNSATEATNLADEVTNSTIKKIDRGCKLTVPNAVLQRMEPKQEPLLVHASFLWLKLRDAPNKGGSYGVEFR